MTAATAGGKVVMECVLETKANVILDSIHGLCGELQLASEEVCDTYESRGSPPRVSFC